MVNTVQTKYTAGNCLPRYRNSCFCVDQYFSTEHLDSFEGHVYLFNET